MRFRATDRTGFARAKRFRQQACLCGDKCLCFFVPIILRPAECRICCFECGLRGFNFLNRFSGFFLRSLTPHTERLPVMQRGFQRFERFNCLADSRQFSRLPGQFRPGIGKGAVLRPAGGQRLSALRQTLPLPFGCRRFGVNLFGQRFQRPALFVPPAVIGQLFFQADDLFIPLFCRLFLRRRLLARRFRRL